MKAKSLIVVTLLLSLVLSGCVRAEKVEGKVDVPPFTIIIDGETYSQDTFKDLQVYECKSISTNRYGSEETYVYTGYQLNDLTAKDAQDSTTLLAFYRDGKTSAENGTVFIVPCKSDFTPDYVKDVEEIVVNDAA